MNFQKIIAQTTLFVLFAVLSVNLVIAQSLPRPNGYVNDFAGKLTAEERAHLENKLVNFEKNTSIEFAIAVVPTLEGRAPKDFTDNLARSWGLGKKDRNNGILLVWAPVERQTYATAGDGLLEDINSEVITSLLNEQMKPYFVKGYFFAGLDAFTSAVISHLGEYPWEKRAEVRGLNAQKAREEAERQHESDILFMKVGGTFLLICGVCLLLYALYDNRRSVNQLKARLGVIAQNLDKALSERQLVRGLIALLKEEIPNQDVSELESEFEKHLGKVAELRSELELLLGSKIKKNHREQINELEKKSEKERDLKKAIERKIEKIKHAKAEVEKLMASIDPKIFSTDGMEIHSGREEEVAEMLSTARANYEQGVQLFGVSGQTVVNFLIIYSLLSDSVSGAESATNYASGASSYYSSNSSSYGVQPSQPTQTISFGGGGGFGSAGGGMSY